jgi:hypothetical protein
MTTNSWGLLFPFLFTHILKKKGIKGTAEDGHGRNGSISRNLGLKGQKLGKARGLIKKLEFLLDRLIAGDLGSSALALECPSQGTSEHALVRARKGIECNAIELNRALVNNRQLVLFRK